MNNLLPRSVKMHLKYDLKGSTYKRRASQKEREKVFPTYKDLDFMQDIPDGLFLDSDMYNALCKTLQRDCLVSGGAGRNSFEPFCWHPAVLHPLLGVLAGQPAVWQCCGQEAVCPLPVPGVPGPGSGLSSEPASSCARVQSLLWVSCTGGVLQAFLAPGRGRLWVEFIPWPCWGPGGTASDAVVPHRQLHGAHGGNEALSTFCPGPAEF